MSKENEEIVDAVIIDNEPKSSSLNLGSSSGFTLSTPKPVTKEVAQHEASSILPALAPEVENEIDEKAVAFVQELSSLTPNSPSFLAKSRDLSHLGADAMTNNHSSRLLQRSMRSMSDSKVGGDAGSAQERVAKDLSELRTVVDDLTPNAQMTMRKKLFGIIPMGNKIDQYFQKYESAEETLEHIMRGLERGKNELILDNAELEKERQHLYDKMVSLNSYIQMAQTLKGKVAAEMNKKRADGNTQEITVYESEVVFPLNQRQQDLMTQMAVSVQSYMAMGLVERNNIELIKGVERAQETTLSALRTAVTVSQALSTQKLVLDQIDAVNKTTNDMIVNTAKMLQQTTERTHQQAVSSGVSIETLRTAFDSLYQTLDEIDRFKSEANTVMETTMQSLSTELNRANGLLAREQVSGRVSAEPSRKAVER